MILDSQEASNRLDSPLNLLNRFKEVVRGSSAKKEVEGIIGIEKEPVSSSGSSSPILPPSLNDNLEEIEDQIKNGLIKSTAKTVLGNALELLNANLPNVDKVSDLSRIARDMREVLKEDKNDKIENHNLSQTIIYRPTVNQESHYQTIHAHE